MEEIGMLVTDPDELEAIRQQRIIANESIKKWYAQVYPNDSEVEYINPEVTFYDLFEALDAYMNIGRVIGTWDSVVRERCFTRLAEIMEISYDEIYEQWLLTKNF